ncbi:MAG: YihA family ribosome biogenesis GTP-binding protein [Clostridia bacterium]|nr:YihA family ribosome biogenesis GTP-binding protein [Clostridia bacterium]
MKINIQNADLAITAGLVAQFPDGRKPQIVFSGRSNVGKSSLINSLLNRKSLARVSSSPGKTITVNFYDVDGKLFFVDIPGYGYAKRAPQDKKRWSELTDRFISSECDKRLVLQLIDMKAGPTEDDLMMLDWLDASGSDYVIVATKADKLNKTDFNLAVTELNKLGAKVIPFSSLSKLGREEVWKTIFEFIER